MEASMMATTRTNMEAMVVTVITVITERMEIMKSVTNTEEMVITEDM
jgi:hypothetical protein